MITIDPNITKHTGEKYIEEVKRKITVLPEKKAGALEEIPALKNCIVHSGSN